MNEIKLGNLNTVEMIFKKSTPGTHVYEDSTTGSPVPSLYIKKDALPKTPPAKLLVQISW